MSTAVLKLLGNGFVALGYECPEELHVKEKCACVWLCLEIIIMQRRHLKNKLKSTYFRGWKLNKIVGFLKAFDLGNL